MSQRISFLLCLILVTSGCNLSLGSDSESLPNIRIVTEPTQTPISSQDVSTTNIDPTPQSTELWDGIYDASEVMWGICFEAAFDAQGTVFTLRNAEEHIKFYDDADNSQLCRRPVGRNPFDFSNGDILTGIWSYGFGCTANHTIDTVTRDDDAKTITIQATFQTDGDCNYELIRPFWLRIANAQDYAVALVVG